MPIFKFHSGNDKPSALKLWTTLMDTPIAPREGYTEEQIRYRMFIYLQLSSVFKTAVSYANKIIDEPTCNLQAVFLPTTASLASCQESDFSDLLVVSHSFPHWVSPELYMPYYLTKMLCHNINNPKLLYTLFDRSSAVHAESLHLNIDHKDSPGLTAYKLYNSLHTDALLNWVTISYDRSPMIVSDQVSMTSRILEQLIMSIEVSTNFIIPDGAKTTIPYFILKASDAPQ